MRYSSKRQGVGSAAVFPLTLEKEDLHPESTNLRRTSLAPRNTLLLRT